MGQRSILRQIASSATVLVVIFAAVWTAGAVLWLWSNVVLGMQRHADLEVRELSAALAPLVWNLDDRAIQTLVGTKAEDPEIVSIVVQESSGGKTWGHPAQGHREAVKRVAPILVRGQSIGTLSLGFSLDPRLTEMAQQIGVLVTSQILLLGIMLLSLTFSWRRVVTRLRTMVGILDEFSEGQLAARMAITGDDELSRLAGGFNTMANRIQSNTLSMEREISERTEKLIEAEKLALVGSLVAGVAHEINTPVGNSVTITSWLLTEAKELCVQMDAGFLSTEDIRTFLADVESSLAIVQSGLNRTSDLVQGFKAIGASQLVDERRVFWMRPFLDEVVASLSPTLRPHPHRIQVECPADFVVDNHAGALFQIVTNLVMNAHVHAFRPDEEATITLRATATPGKTRFQLEVQDEGVGMAADVVDRIFEPFFTTARTRGGTGLGLSIVASLVKSLGGTIDVRSDPGRGSVFQVRLPLVAPDQP